MGWPCTTCVTCCKDFSSALLACSFAESKYENLSGVRFCNIGALTHMRGVGSTLLLAEVQ